MVHLIFDRINKKYIVGMEKEDLMENVDYYWVERKGMRYRIFTEFFLLERGYCCNNNCQNCPYSNDEVK